MATGDPGSNVLNLNCMYTSIVFGGHTYSSLTRLSGPSSHLLDVVQPLRRVYGRDAKAFAGAR